VKYLYVYTADKLLVIVSLVAILSTSNLVLTFGKNLSTSAVYVCTMQCRYCSSVDYVDSFWFSLVTIFLFYAV